MAIRTQNGRVLLKNGRVSCECCAIPEPPGGGDPCINSNQLNLPFGTEYPPAEGLATNFGSGVAEYIFHLSHQEYLYYTETPAQIKETISFRLEYDLETPIVGGKSLFFERRGFTGELVDTYNILQPFCGFEIYNRAETQLPFANTNTSRLRVSEVGLYSNCNLPLGDGWENSRTQGLLGVEMYRRVIFVEDVREGIEDEERVHLLFARFIAYPARTTTDVLNPYDNNQIIFSYGETLYYEMSPTLFTGGPHPALPAGSTDSMSVSLFGKNLPVYAGFEAGVNTFVQALQPCWISVTGFNWTNFVSEGSYNLEFIPLAP